MTHTCLSLLAKGLLLWAVGMLGAIGGGCASTRECNPYRDPGLFGSIACQSQGRYDELIDTREGEVQAERDRSATLSTELDEATAQRTAVEKDVRSAKYDLRATDTRLQSVRAKTREVQTAQ